MLNAKNLNYAWKNEEAIYGQFWQECLMGIVHLGNMKILDE